MSGRIRRQLLASKLDAVAQQALARPVTPVCPLCDRPVPASQADAHHLVPRSKGGKHTLVLHRICHRQIHALLTETELARGYCTVEALRAHPGLAAFVRWVRNKPPEFIERTRKSQRLKG
jgi:hypothetical protein